MSKGKQTETEYLIVGNSAGGIGAAEAIRETDADGRLIMVSDEPYQAYSRPLISEYLAHERVIDNMLFRKQDFYERKQIELLTGIKVTGINPDKRTAQLDNGSIVKWHRLLLATGGAPIVPVVNGLEKQGVFSFIKLEDALRIDAFLNRVRHAVVIGGGLIGISISEALAKRGIAVTVVEMKDRILNMILDKHSSAIAATALAQHGLHIITNDTVAEITGDEKVQGVRLNSGKSLPCEMVIVAIGVRPRLDLVEGTGIEVNHGIVVDRHMATSRDGVYACGDVSEAYDYVTGSSRLTPVWPNAYTGGRIAGYNMAGMEKLYNGGTTMNSINYFGLDIVSAGLVSISEGGPYEELCINNDCIYRKFILSDGLIKGMILGGNIERSGIVFGLMRDSINVEPFKDRLLSGDFGLIDLPAALRRERIGTLTAHQHVVPIKEAEELPVAGE